MDEKNVSHVVETSFDDDLVVWICSLLDLLLQDDCHEDIRPFSVLSKARRCECSQQTFSIDHTVQGRH